MNFSRKQLALFYLIAAVMAPLFVGIVRSVLVIGQTMIQPPAPDSLIKEQDRPVVDAKRGLPAFAILSSGVTSEIGETLYSAATLSDTLGSSRYTLFNVNPTGKPVPLTGGVVLVPTFSAAQLAQALTAAKTKLEALIVPSSVDLEEKPFLEALKQLSPLSKRLIFQGEAAKAAGRNGDLTGKHATSHFVAESELKEQNTSTHWEFDQNVVKDGELFTSAGGATSGLGVLAAIDPEEFKALDPAILSSGHAVDKMVLGPYDFLRLFLTTSFSWKTLNVGVFIYPGFSDAWLGATLALLPRTFTIRTYTIGLTSDPVRSDAGLFFSPTFLLKDADRPDFLLLPPLGASAAPTDQGKFNRDIRPMLSSWATDQKVNVREINAAHLRPIPRPKSNYLTDSSTHLAVSAITQWLASTDLDAADRLDMIVRLGRTEEATLGDATLAQLVESRPFPWKRLVGLFGSSLCGVFVLWLVLFFMNRPTKPLAA